MSLESWEAEFYSTDPETTAPEGAVAHSLRKWMGLRQDAMQRHGVSVKDARLGDGGRDWLGIDSSSCALCVHHLNDFWPDEEDHEDPDETRPRCDGCPLVAVLGRSCDDDVFDDNGERVVEKAPYFTFVEHNDPEPMIAALEAAAKLEAKK